MRETLTRLLFKAIRDFQVAAMFSLYRAMSGARSRCLLQISLSFSRCLSFSRSIHSGASPFAPPSFSPTARVWPAFAKAVIFQQLRRSRR